MSQQQLQLGDNDYCWVLNKITGKIDNVEVLIAPSHKADKVVRRVANRGLRRRERGGGGIGGGGAANLYDIFLSSLSW
jgi:hypothetical protein